MTREQGIYGAGRYAATQELSRKHAQQIQQVWDYANEQIETNGKKRYLEGKAEGTAIGAVGVSLAVLGWHWAGPKIKEWFTKKR